jgi:hypothetical protein
VVALPKGLEFDGDLDARTTLQGRVNVVMTIGRLVPGEERNLQLRARAAEGQANGTSCGTTTSIFRQPGNTARWTFRPGAAIPWSWN